MKLATYEYNGRVGIGAIANQTIVDITTAYPDMLSLIAAGTTALVSLRSLMVNPTHAIPIERVRLRAPIPTPQRNVMCLGKNYAEHARESNEARGEKVEIPEFPVIFTKATTTVNGPYDDVVLDPAVSVQMDYEAELAFIIGRPTKNATRETAMASVFGYTVLNDITARDLQAQHKQFFKGKSLDGCCPIGPWIVTADEIPDPHGLSISCHVNGEHRQEGNTSEMLFDIPAIIVHLSRGMTLLPGDIIATGTPSGVGFARQPPVYLQPGDIVECAVGGIGAIRNQMVAV